MALNSRLQGIRFRMVDYLLETKKWTFVNVTKGEYRRKCLSVYVVERN
jgi:hypothetical protein